MASWNRSQWPHDVNSTSTSDTTSLSDSSTSSLPLLSSSASLDVSQIHGNVSDKSKRLVMNTLKHHYSPGVKENSFGIEVGRRLMMKSMNVWENSHDAGRIPSRATKAQTVFEITVARDMCNPYGTLHGACACYIVDPCAMSAILVLGAALGVDATGISQSMNLIWHQPAKMGTKLRVVSNSVFIERRIKTARIEIIDSETDKLYVSAIHSTINAGGSSSQSGVGPRTVLKL